MSENKEKVADELIDAITKNINNNPEFLANWNKTFQMLFEDINVAYTVKVSIAGKVEKVEKTKGVKDGANVTVNINTPATLKGLLDQSLSGMDAFSQGLIKTDDLGELMAIQSAFPKL